MKNFEYTIDTSLESFNLIHIFECGQCFRWEKQEDESYTGVIKDTVLNVNIIDGKVHLKGVTLMDNIEEYLNEYFDLNTDYSKYKDKLLKVDEYLERSINFGYGIRILKQDLWETIISFIISANTS